MLQSSMAPGSRLCGLSALAGMTRLPSVIPDDHREIRDLGDTELHGRWVAALRADALGRDDRVGVRYASSSTSQ